MLWDLPARPNGKLLRRALRQWAFVVPGQGEMPTEDRLVLQWVTKESRPLVDLHDPVLARDVLESLRRSRWVGCARTGQPGQGRLMVTRPAPGGSGDAVGDGSVTVG